MLMSSAMMLLSSRSTDDERWLFYTKGGRRVLDKIEALRWFLMMEPEQNKNQIAFEIQMI